MPRDDRTQIRRRSRELIEDIIASPNPREFERTVELIRQNNPDLAQHYDDVRAASDEHIASANCWCRPVQDDDEPTVWVHSDTKRHTDTDTEMQDYQPSPHAVTQGEDACQ